jgi:hypothetical protein
VVECKRVQDAAWLFLVSTETLSSLTRGKVLRSERAGRSGSTNARAVRGGLLLRSSESLGNEELGFIEQQNYPRARYYFPVILTNAQLYACRYSPSDVDLSTGELPSGNFEKVGFIRFRKGLSSSLPSPSTPESLSKSNQQNERTVFIVNSGALFDFLSKFSISG